MKNVEMTVSTTERITFGMPVTTLETSRTAITGRPETKLCMLANRLVAMRSTTSATAGSTSAIHTSSCSNSSLTYGSTTFAYSVGICGTRFSTAEITCTLAVSAAENTIT